MTIFNQPVTYQEAKKVLQQYPILSRYAEGITDEVCRAVVHRNEDHLAYISDPTERTCLVA